MNLNRFMILIPNFYRTSMAGCKKIANRMSIGTNNHHARGLASSQENGTRECSLKQQLTLFEGGLFVSHPSLIEDFSPTKSVATCFMISNGKLLLLKRNDLTYGGHKWSAPGGKLEPNETPLAAVIREAKEETGIQLVPEHTNLIRTIYVRLLVGAPKLDYPLHLFKAVLPGSSSSDCKVILNHEHSDYLWIDPIAAQQQLNLMPGGKEILHLIYSTL